MPEKEGQRGAALILVLVLSTISLLIMTAVLYMVTVGTQLSGGTKRYRTAHEAALAGVEILSQGIQMQAPVSIGSIVPTWNASFAGKIATPDISGFSNMCLPIDCGNAATYDVVFDIGSPAYRVCAKMILKRPGNTQKSYKPVAVKTGVVPTAPQAGGLTEFTYYTFTIVAQSAVNPNERVKMDLVHIF